MDPKIQILLTALTSFGVTFFSLPSVIRAAKSKNLCDEPSERKTHKGSVPNLGGLGIFAGFIFSVCFWSNQTQILELQYIIAALIIMFFMGIKDDILDLRAYKKLLAQILAALIIVIPAKIQLSSFYGIFEIFDIPIWVAIPFTTMAIVGITNAINLIDGIDTYAASIGILASTFFGTWFYLTGNLHYTILAFAMIGSLLAFLFFNRSPSRVIMGDTGSLILGLVLSILCIKFIELNRLYYGDKTYQILSAPTVAIAVLIIPIFDLLRVFTLRILQGRSPFSPDRNHLHHILVDQGYSHHKACFILIAVNILCITLTLRYMHFNSELLLFGNIVFMMGFTGFFQHTRQKRRKLIHEN